MVIVRCLSPNTLSKQMSMRKDDSAEWLPLVDENGIVVGKAQRGECHDGKRMLLHPVVHLHVFNKQGNLLLQHRPKWKTIQPNKWDTAVGGHVDYGETIEQALLRETREEIGLEDIDPRFLCRYIHQSEVERELVNVFFVMTDSPLHPSEEVDELRYFTLSELQNYKNTGFFTPNFEEEWEMLNQRHLLPF